MALRTAILVCLLVMAAGASTSATTSGPTTATTGNSSATSSVPSSTTGSSSATSSEASTTGGSSATSSGSPTTTGSSSATSSGPSSTTGSSSATSSVPSSTTGSSSATSSVPPSTTGNSAAASSGSPSTTGNSSAASSEASTTSGSSATSSGITSQVTTSGSSTATSPGNTNSTNTTATTTTLTTTSTTTTTTTPKYETKPPNLEKAVFVFSFVIRGPNFTDLWNRTLKEKFEDAFNKTPGFKDVDIRPATGPSRRKREASGENNTIETTFKAAELDTENLADNLTSAIMKVNDSLQNTSLAFAEGDIEALVRGFVNKTSDNCNAKNVTCDLGFKCRTSKCFFLCEDHYCGDHGICYVNYPGNDSKIQPACKCQSDDVYEYRGDTCEEAALHQKWVIAITCSVGGFLVLVLTVLLVCLCCHRYRSKPKDKSAYTDAYESTGNGYQGSNVATRHRTSYDNEAYEADRYNPLSGSDTNLHQYYSLPPEDDRLAEPSPMLVPYSGQFVIQRPKLLIRPKTEEYR